MNTVRRLVRARPEHARVRERRLRLEQQIAAYHRQDVVRMQIR